MHQELNEIRAETQSVRQLLHDRKYRLDYYQREYSWERKHVEELLADLENKFLLAYDPVHRRPTVATYPHYFLGSIVIARKEGKRFIIDGQQRLTTLSLLFIYLNHLQRERTEKVPLDGLIFSEVYGERSFNLEVDDRRACMNALFQGHDFEPPEQQGTDANLVGRYRDIEELFPDTLSAAATLPFFIDWLMLNVDMVEITAYNDEDAYTIFETMNDRGKPLSPTDMLKGYLLACVPDPERKQALNELWAAEMMELRSLGKNEEAAFFKAWLRSQHSEAIRQRQANTSPQDFDKFGTEFHRVVRDEHDRLGLRGGGDFEGFIERQMVRFAAYYIDLQDAETAVTHGLEYARYNAASGFGHQPMVCLAPIRVEDDPIIARLKMNLAAGYLDILIVRRNINWKSISSSTMQYAMFLLMKEIRGLSLEELRGNLRDKALKLDEELPWLGLEAWAIHSQNSRHVRNLLARITSHIEAEAGMVGPGFDEYIRRTGKDPFDIEHVWADKFDRHQDEFEAQQDFAAYRNRFGGLLLVPASFNRSYGAELYEQKLPHYLKQNLLAKSLHPLAYEHDPGFARYTERSKLPFRSHETFRRGDLDQRQHLYQAICEEIFSPVRFEAEEGEMEAEPTTAPLAQTASTHAQESLTTVPEVSPGSEVLPEIASREKMRESWHGTVNGYSGHKCRCADCRAANTRYMLEYRKSKFSGKLCTVPGCHRMASHYAGNGLCKYHHERRRGVPVEQSQ
jgi:uncharacterized protein DUF262/uncharacterized protein DUF1524